ncbi:MAG: EFR1 family ferrodoxin [Spirochaetes bacterium]|nr:EFR1 family ferrodoxin [Spirochaetota bacterium]
MSDLKIALIYFSATNVTRTYAEVIQKELISKGCEVKLFDVTSFSSRQKPLPLDNYNAFIFGFPVFGDFAPGVINDWLAKLKGNGTNCATYFTYGGRSTGYAHFHTRSLLKGAGFTVQFTAEFLGRHSINLAGWNLIPSRPDNNDFTIAKQFANLAVERFTADSAKPFCLQTPFAYDAKLAFLKNIEKKPERAPNQPVRIQENCSMCRLCETECPNQSFNADTGLSDPLKCISCFRCVYICPDKVIKVDDKMKEFYPHFLMQWSLTEEMAAAKKSRIITDFLEASC